MSNCRFTPLNDMVIVEVIEPTNKSNGGIILPGDAVENSTIGRVAVPNSLSYHRNGELRQPLVKKGDMVRFAKNAGTEMPEAPAGMKLRAIPEDMIYYIVEKFDE